MAVFGLLLFFGLGAPVALWLPRTIIDRWSAAPVFGLAVFGVVETLAYFNGFLHEATIALVVIAAVSLVLFVIKLKDRAWLIALIGYGLLVGIVCLAPSWVGGMKFAIYQGNPSDQFNYISLASAVGSRSYQAVSNAGVNSEATFIRVAAVTLAGRPTVGIVLASFRPWFYPTTAEAAYPFLALLQAISAFGALFVFRNIFGTGKLLGLLLAAAFAVGFFAQYVVDINAWSSLSSLSFASVALALVYLVATKGAGLEFAGPLAIVLTAIFYYYPESSVVCAISCGVVSLGGLALSQDRVKSAAYLTFAVCAALIVCLPAWRATIGFLLAQAAFSHSVPLEWFLAHDSFYFADLAPPNNDWTPYRIFSAPIDAVAGLIGVYFVAPSAALPTSAKVIWKLAEAALFISLAVTIARSIRTNQSAIFLAGCLAVLLLPAALLFQGDYWTAGKAVTMVAPLLFLVLAYPLTQPLRTLAIPAAIIVALHLGFGIQRIAAATDETGMRAGAGYPGVPHLKALYDWTVPRWRADLAGCTRVAVDVVAPHLEQLVETVLNDLSIPSDFRTERNLDYALGTVVPATTRPSAADCTVSDQWKPAARTKLIYLSAGDHRDLLRRSVTGLHGTEAWSDGILRWTDGNAQWSIPSEERIAAISISLWADVIPPGTAVQVLVNGREIVNRPVWKDVQRFAIDQSGPLTITIKSSTFRSPNDPRGLGLALKSVTIEDRETSIN